MTHTDLAKGTRIQSLWDTERRGILKYPARIDKSAGEVIVLWDNGETTKEVYGADVVKHLPEPKIVTIPLTPARQMTIDKHSIMYQAGYDCAAMVFSYLPDFKTPQEKLDFEAGLKEGYRIRATGSRIPLKY